MRPKTTEKTTLIRPLSLREHSSSRAGQRPRKVPEWGREPRLRDGTERPETAGQNKPGTEEFILSPQECILSVPGTFFVPQERNIFREEQSLGIKRGTRNGKRTRNSFYPPRNAFYPFPENSPFLRNFVPYLRNEFISIARLSRKTRKQSSKYTPSL